MGIKIYYSNDIILRVKQHFPNAKLLFGLPYPLNWIVSISVFY